MAAFKADFTAAHSQTKMSDRKACLAALIIACLGLVACDQQPQTIELRSKAGFTDTDTSDLYQDLALTAGSEPTLPLMELAAHEVCSGVMYRDAMGVKREGQKSCQQVSDCTKSGATGCRTTAIYQALNKKAIDYSAIVSGQSFLGKTGSYTVPSYPDCKATNDSECVSSADYLPIGRSMLSPGKFKKGVPIGTELVGDYPSPRYTLHRLPDSSQSLAETGVAKAAAMNASFYFWDAEGTPHKVSGDPKLVSANIMPGHTVYGVKEGAVEPVAKPCSREGDSNCTSGSGWVALDKTSYTAGDLKKGLRLGDKIGSYPSATSPLKEGTPTADLNMASFGQLKSSASFEFFDRTGKSYRQNGSASLAAVDNIKKGVILFGTTGEFRGAKLPGLSRFDLRTGLKTPGDNQDSMLKLQGWCLSRQACEDRHWQDITDKTNSENKKCTDGSDTCVFRSFVQMNDWAFPLKKGLLKWTSAIKVCQDMNLYGKRNWRLPTQKELMMAVGNSLVAQQIFTTSHYKTNTERPKFWTSTAFYPKRANGTIERFIFDTQTDGIAKALDSTQQNVLCVRELEPAEAKEAKANR